MIIYREVDVNFVLGEVSCALANGEPDVGDAPELAQNHADRHELSPVTSDDPNTAIAWPTTTLKERAVDSTTQERAIRALEDRRLQAMLAGDTETMEELLTDDFQYFHSSGARDTKSTYLAKVGSGMFSGLTAETSFEQVWVGTDAAFMRGKMVASAEIEGVRREFVNHPFAVWQRRDGRWQLLAYQVTPTQAG